MGNCSRKKTKAAEEDEGASGETKGKRRKGVSKEEGGRGGWEWTVYFV